MACARASGPGDAAGLTGDSPRQLGLRVVASYPHDPGAWTQGLLWHDGALYESVGQYGRSGLRRVALEDGTVEQEVRLADDRFGEGLARVGNTLYQLTWRSGLGLRYDLESFEARGDFGYEGEGWGLCWNGRELVRSDGSQRLFFHDPSQFALLRTVEVRRGAALQARLNELECVDGWVYANILGGDEIVRIDPGSGRIEAVIDASGLLSVDERQGTDVLNGIAHNASTGTFYLTGKHWPKLFEVEFVEASRDGPR